MKKVVLATDGSPCAEEAAWFLAHLPHANKLDLTVVTVIEAPYVNRSYLTSDWILKSVVHEKAFAVESFQRIEQLFEGADVTLRHVIREGDRGVSIVQVADEQQADLIVVGARGHSMVARLLLGSTSDFVATHAHCSVLVVRPTGLRHSDRPLRIAIGYEDSPPAQAALNEFSEISWGRQTHVDLVSVVSFASGFFSEIDVDSTASKQAATEAVQHASNRLHGSLPHAQAHLVESDHIGEGLVLFAKDTQADLLVVGESPRSLLGRIFLGSVPTFVLRHAPCSVWITRNRVVQETDRSAAQAHHTSTSS